MPEEPFATRREFDMLVSRVDNIDRDGTRGVVAVQAQLTDAIKDVMELKSDMGSFKRDTAVWFEKHSEHHEQEMKSRISSRRWMIGTAFAGMAAMATVLALLIQIVGSLHH